MKKILLSFLGIAALSMVSMMVFNEGALHSSSTGAPSATCTNPGCHAGPVNTDGAVELMVVDTATEAPVSSYVPGKVYGVYVSLTRANCEKMGFALSTTGGTLAKFSSDNTVQLINGYATHTSSGTATDAGMNEWFLLWTAPASGNVTFQAYVNASNNNNGSSGDEINGKSLSINTGTTGLKKLDPTTSFKVYPMPANGTINLLLDQQYESNMDIALYDLQGQLVKQLATGVQAKGGSISSLDISGIASGVYLIGIKSETGNAIQKIVIQ